jgi:hypothetical protein
MGSAALTGAAGIAKSSGLKIADAGTVRRSVATMAGGVTGNAGAMPPVGVVLSAIIFFYKFEDLIDLIINLQGFDYCEQVPSFRHLALQFPHIIQAFSVLQTCPQALNTHPRIKRQKGFNLAQLESIPVATKVELKIVRVNVQNVCHQL